MIIDNLASLPSTITTGDELPVERGTTTYKIDYNALAAAILARLGAGSDNIVDVANGGTGANNARSARSNLELVHAKNLDSTVNVDNIRDSGLYYCQGCSATGFDDDLRIWGQLLVISSAPWKDVGTPGQYDRLCQVYFYSFQNAGQKWIQYRIYDSTWSGWRVLLDNNGAVPVASGGTGAATAAAARTNLGITPANIGALPNNDIVSTARGSVEKNQSVDITVGSTGVCLIFIQRNNQGGAIYGVNGNVLTPYITVSGVTATLESNNTVLRISNTTNTMTYLLLRIGVI